MSVLAGAGFIAFDRTKSGFISSAATAVGGPLIEVGLISWFASPNTNEIFSKWGYHYTDSGELGFFPLWIVPGM